MFKKRKKLTKEIIDKILSGEYAIWHWGQVEGQRPFQVAYPGKATLHDYPGKKSYFTVPNAKDKFYFKEYDYFWFVCKNEPPEGSPKEPDAYDDMLADPEAMPDHK